MKKIAVVTWFRRGHNLGSSLQAFSMEKYLEKNYYVEFIDYNQEHKNISKKIKTFLKNCFFRIYNKRIISTWKKYDEWVNENINYSYKLSNFNDLKKYSEKFDAAICGSDQIWNNDLNCDPFYYLRFIDEKKRIAYAPSIGRNYLRNDLKDLYKRFISEIKYVSVREENAKRLIKEELNIDVNVCLDPTFLLTKEEWENIVKNNDSILDGNNSIFVYLLEPNKQQLDSITEYAKKISKKVVIPVVNPYYKYDDSAIIINQNDFLNYIHKADLIITDSFHGMVFSIIFNKNFNIFKRFKDNDKNSQNSRIDDLLTLFNISQDVYVNNNIINHINIDYSIVNKLIEKEAKKSRDFLNKSLDSVTKVKK